MLFSTFELAVLSASLHCSLFQTCSNASSLERTSPNTLSKIAISPYNSLFLIIALADTTLYIYLYSCSLYPTITKTTSIFYSQLYPLCLKQCLAHNRCWLNVTEFLLQDRTGSLWWSWKVYLLWEAFTLKPSVIPVIPSSVIKEFFMPNYEPPQLPQWTATLKGKFYAQSIFCVIQLHELYFWHVKDIHT